MVGVACIGIVKGRLFFCVLGLVFYLSWVIFVFPRACFLCFEVVFVSFGVLLLAELACLLCIL